MKSKKDFAFLVLCVLLVADTTLADLPPWQRGSEGTTYQEWSFSDNNSIPVPDVVDNPYGTPLLRVTSIGDWIPGLGAWPLSGEIDVYIPNWPELRPEKEIWLQLTWKATDVDPFLPNEPLIGVAPFTSMDIFHMEDLDLGNGWVHTPFKINLWPNPLEEWITIKGDILVDYLVIDTICIPEPATLALLGIGALITLTRKAKAARVALETKK